MKALHAWTMSDDGEVVPRCGATGGTVTFRDGQVSCKRCLPRPYLVMYGTLTEIVEARTVVEAWRSWHDTFLRQRGIRVDAAEVTVRRLRPADAPWIESALGTDQSKKAEALRLAIERVS